MSDNGSPRSRPGSVRRPWKQKQEMENSNSSRPPSPTDVPAQSTTSVDDQVIPTAIVIKNIPFSVKRDALLNLLSTLDIPSPYALNYHFDNGVFRGLAFANYRTPQEAEAVIKAVNGLEVSGRRLRVEYKRVLPAAIEKDKEEKKKEKEEEATPAEHTGRRYPAAARYLHQREQHTKQNDVDSLDLNDPEVLELYNELIVFKSDPSRQQITMPKTMTAKQRRDAHLIAEKLGLAHFSEGFGADRQLHIAKKSAAASTVRHPRNASVSNLKQSASHEGFVDSKREGTHRKTLIRSNSASAMNGTSEDTDVLRPIRQPRGPEPGKNFESRKHLAEQGVSTDITDGMVQLHINA